MAEHDRVGNDEYGFWKDEPTSARRGLFATGSHRRPRQTQPGDEHVAADPTPTAAYDPWLDDDLDTVSFGATSAGPAQGNYGYAWSLDDDDDDDAEIRRAAPLAPVYAGGRAPIDPLFKRIGVIVGAIALALPLGLALRGNDSPSSSLKAPPATQNSVVAGSGAANGLPTTVAGLVQTAPLPVDVGVTSTSSYPTSSVTEKSSPNPGRAITAAAESSPVGTTGSAKPATVTKLPSLVCGYSSYRVVKGDFWAQIAKKADVRLGDLLTVNQSTVDTPLFPGDKVCMPPNARSTTTVAASSSTAAPSSTDPSTSAADTSAAPTTAAASTAAPTTAAPTTAAPTTKPPQTAAPSTAAPTTKPPQTSTPAGTVPPGSYSRNQVIQIIRDAWPDELEERALQIAQRESNLLPGVRNWCCFGLFQIYFNAHKSWLAGEGVTSAEQLYDPRVNARIAYTLYQRAGGWGPWT